MGTGNGRVPIIEGRQVSKEYAGTDKRRTVALAGVDVVFYEGEITLLIGPSGCGKTTLLNIIAGFEKADSGAMLERGAPITAPHPRRGVIFQDPNLFPWLTVWENLMFGPHVRGEDLKIATERAENLLAMVGLLKSRDHLPHQLSGGMRHRVAIIRTLANAPKILLADEPFTALDEHTRRKLQQDFYEIVSRTKQTVIFVTHNIDEAIYLADRMVVMSPSPGRVKKIVEVNLPRPRNILDMQFNEYRTLLFNLITPDIVPD